MSFFETEIVKCEEIYKSHLDKKGESWKDCSIDFLREKLREEFEEWNTVIYKDSEEKELCDLVNVSLMLIARLEISEE